ncbi:MAG: hypothetical protein CL927_15365 [Deltaproteobacteria bacterium]|nr:hypothetical protein [Deltaproteobacteria bacterium]HCH61463.1 hypothetical protein [Deltaproteobacteria bacterium]
MQPPLRWPVTAVLIGTACGLENPYTRSANTAAEARPAVLLITLDTTRADHLSPYGYGLVETPIYDRFAAEGVVFERAYATCPLTIPSHSTIMTGRPPPSHGVRDNGDFILSDDAITLAERFSAAGWTTAAFTSAFPTQARWGFSQGFDLYHDPLPRQPTQRDWRDERRARDVIDDAIERMDALPAGPVFSWVHLFDAHWPYDPPEPFASQYAGRPYDGEIAYAAAEVERLLAWWDERHQRSIVLITSDHGEGLGDGGEQTHGFLLHDGTIRVPLIIRTRGMDATWPTPGTRVSTPVSHIDIAPTLLRMAGLDIHPEVMGRDLAEGGTPQTWSEALTAQFSLGLSPLYALTGEAGRYVEGVDGAFYPFVGSGVLPIPDVQTDLAPWQEAMGKTRATFDEVIAPSATLDPDDLAMLQALGYIGGDPSAEAGDVDPRDVIHVIPLTWQVRQAIGARRFGLAQKQLAVLEAHMPNTWGVDHLRASLSLAQGKQDDALHQFVDLFQRSPSSTIALHIAEIFTSRAQWSSAEDWYTETLSLQPMSPEAMAGLVRTAMATGQPELAWERTMRGLLAHPDHAELALARASLLLAEGRAETAEEEALRALNAMPGEPWAHLVHAETLWEQGDADPAIDGLIEALRLSPTDLPVRIELTTWLLEVGRNAEARRIITPAAKLLPDLEEVQALSEQAEAAVQAELAQR